MVERYLKKESESMRKNYPGEPGGFTEYGIHWLAPADMRDCVTLATGKEHAEYMLEMWTRKGSTSKGELIFRHITHGRWEPYNRA